VIRDGAGLDLAGGDEAFLTETGNANYFFPGDSLVASHNAIRDICECSDTLERL